MKILFLSQFFSSTRGGGEHLFYIIAKKLAENNHQVWIITNKIEDENYPVHKNLKIVFVPPVLKYQGGLPPSIKDNMQYLINAVKIGRKIIKENKTTVVLKPYEFIIQLPKATDADVPIIFAPHIIPFARAC